MTKARMGILVGIAAVVVAAAVWVLPLLFERSLRDTLAEQLGVADSGTLFLNLPPRPQRYPGSLLLAPPLGLPIELVTANDGDLLRSGAYVLHTSHEGSTSAGGGVSSPVFSELLKHERRLQMQIEVPDGRTVEMPLDRLHARVQASPTAQASIDAASPATVIVRAYEGRLVYHVTRGSDWSGKAWTEFTQQVQTAGGSDATAKVELEAGGHESGEIRIETTEPVVFAYEAARISDVLANVVAAAAHPLTAAPTAPDAERAIETLLRLGPANVPALDEALREIGSDAAPAVLQLMERPDPEFRERGAVLLRRLPPPAAAAGQNRVERLASPDALVRAWSVAQAGTGGAAEVPELSRALADDNPAVRFLATRALAERGAAASAALPALRERLTDPDESVRLAAASATLTIDPQAPLPVAELRASLTSDNEAVRRASLETLGKLGTRAAPVLPEIERAAAEAQAKSDEKTKRLATETVRRVRPR